MSPRHSYTAWSTFDQCPLKYKLRHIDRLPEPPSKALLRGRQVHDLLEGVLAAGPAAALPLEVLAMHDRCGGTLEAIMESGDYVAERRIELDRDWKVGPAWVVAKVDVAYSPREDVCSIVDWKTGRTPLADYRKQGDLYAAAAVSVWPRDYYSTVFVNVDSGEVDGLTYTAAEARALQPAWKDRFRRVEAETDFAPKENKYCKWCVYGKSKGGLCPLG